MNELFILDSDGLVDINKVWIQTVKSFKIILVRDKGSVGDAQARKKLQAKKEFTFIYHMLDFRSPAEKFSDNDKLKYAIINSELPDNFDYTKDKELTNAYNTYNKYRYTPSLRLLLSARKSLFTANRVVENYNDRLVSMLDSLDQILITSEGITDETNKHAKETLSTLLDSVNKLIKLTNDIPNAIDNLEKREEQVKKELASGGRIKGGHSDGYRTLKLYGS